MEKQFLFGKNWRKGARYILRGWRRTKAKLDGKQEARQRLKSYHTFCILSSVTKLKGSLLSLWKIHSMPKKRVINSHEMKIKNYTGLNTLCVDYLYSVIPRCEVFVNICNINVNIFFCSKFTVFRFLSYPFIFQSLVLFICLLYSQENKKINSNNEIQILK